MSTVRRLIRSPMIQAMVLTMFAVVVWATACLLTSVRPTRGMSLDEFAAIAPAPSKVLLVGQGTACKVIWISKLQNWKLPSGPGCYVFDHDLRLWEWSDDTGESSKLTADLRNALQNGKLVRLSDAVVHLRNGEFDR